jgi:thioredoxin-related protein
MSRKIYRSMNVKEPISISRSRRIRAALCLTGGIAAFILCIQFFAKSTTPSSLVRLDQPIPSLVIENSGVPLDLKKHIEGKRSVLVFYSPACRICKEIVPYLHPMPAGLRLILINESSDQEKSLTAQFPGADQLQDPHQVLIQSFTTLSLPTILFVDENGILRDGLAGRHQRDFIQKKLKQFAVDSYSNALTQNHDYSK